MLQVISTALHGQNPQPFGQNDPQSRMRLLAYILVLSSSNPRLPPTLYVEGADQCFLGSALVTLANYSTHG